MSRLCDLNLDQVPGHVLKPGYQRDNHGAGIVHLGVGAFHRAHQAIYTEQALAEAGGDWRITGASLSSRTAIEQLMPQNCLYTQLERSADNIQCRIVGAIDSVLDARDQTAEVILKIADPAVRIVSLTVTEKGYCYNAGLRELDTSDPKVQRDIKHLHSPTTAPGLLVAGLDARRRAGGGRITLLSCDNLPANGQVLQKVVCQLAAQVDQDLATWIEDTVSFPGTMVDRITPATTDADLKEIGAAIGMDDAGGVVCEPFTQWVIEDNFAAGRPAWEAGGAMFVTDVEPFETIKLRLLNGSHSAIAYLGVVAGIEFVHEVMRDQALCRVVDELMLESMSTLEPPAAFDVPEYCRQLTARFSNPAIQHRTAQIAMDGSQKLPQRIVAPLVERLAAGQSVKALVLVIAAWMRFVMGKDEKGAVLDLHDPMSEQLVAVRDRHGENPAAFARELMQIESIFPRALSGNNRFNAQVSTALISLCDRGVAATIVDM